jgi:hypothetical protein
MNTPDDEHPDAQKASTSETQPSPEPAARLGPLERNLDDRPEMRDVFRRIKEELPALERLLAEVETEYEDLFYRFYHQSFKVYRLQAVTKRVVEALQGLASGRDLNPWFLEIVREGMGKVFEREHNQRWKEITRPMLEAFGHARQFLEMIVRYGRQLDEPPLSLPSGWAAVLYLYNLR